MTGVSASDRGAGTLLTLVMMPIVLIGILLLWSFVDLSMLRAKAAGAADLAALAGAALLVTDPDRACVMAADVAARNDSTMTGCEIDALDLIVTVEIPSTGIAARLAAWVGVTLPSVRQTARAGL